MSQGAIGYHAAQEEEAAAGPTTPYRGLYLSISHGGGSLTGLAEVQFHDRGGSNYDASGDTKTGNMTSGGGLAAGFDGTTNQAHASSPRSTATSGTIGIDLGAGNERDFDTVTVWEPNNAKVDGGNDTEVVNISLYGTTDGSASGGTLIRSWSNIHNGIGNSVFTTEVELNIDTGAINVLSP